MFTLNRGLGLQQFVLHSQHGSNFQSSTALHV